MKKLLLSIVTVSAFSTAVNAQNVIIPDASFKAYLLGNAAINTDADPTEISVTEASSYTGSIICPNLGISDLSGIESFVNITGLTCSNNAIGTLDVSQNTALFYLSCYSNGLSSLEVTQNTALQNLQCYSNTISTLDLSQNTSLAGLNCNVNNLSTLDLSQNTVLTSLSCSVNNLTSLDLSQNPSVVEINCIQNNIVFLDVSACINLLHLGCQNNAITALDVSNNTSLIGLNCDNNNLTVLNMRNLSTTTNLTSYFYATSNNLTCIDVDAPSAATTTWTNIDPSASYAINCQIDLVTSIDVQGQAGETTIAIQGGTLQMEAYVLPSYADDGTYTWSVSNGTGSASIDAGGLLTAITNGDVTVTATAIDASGVTGSVIITISNQSSASIYENEISELVELYPNPVQTELFINSKENIESIEIRNSLGQIVKKITSNYNSIDVSDLKQGVYFLQIETGKGLVSERFIKK